MTAATVLALRGCPVTILEAGSTLGGTWVVEGLPDQPSRHSPQILISAYLNTIDILKKMDIDMFAPRYAEKFSSESFTLLKSSLSLCDWVKVGTLFARAVALNYKLTSFGTVQQDLSRHLSPQGAHAINSLCFLVDGVSADKFSTVELLKSFDQTALYRNFMPVLDHLVRDWGNKLKAKEQVTVLLNTKVISIKRSGIGSTIISDVGSFKIGPRDKMMLATDPLNLVRLLDGSPDIQNLWGDWKLQRVRLLSLVYVSWSVQLEFDAPLRLPLQVETGNITQAGLIVFNMPHAPNVLFVGMLSGSRDFTFSSPKNILSHVVGTLKPWFGERTLVDAYLGKSMIWSSTAWDFHLSGAAVSVTPIFPRQWDLSDSICIIGTTPNHSFAPTTMEAAVETALTALDEPVRTPWRLSQILIGACCAGLLLILVVYACVCV